tara:strand:+ start:2132 stop:2476 length:345 start_codon:yes stop_codon:yes gene_type:complete
MIVLMWIMGRFMPCHYIMRTYRLKSIRQPFKNFHNISVCYQLIFNKSIDILFNTVPLIITETSFAVFIGFFKVNFNKMYRVLFIAYSVRLAQFFVGSSHTPRSVSVGSFSIATH